jgi:hypothetical protein
MGTGAQTRAAAQARRKLSTAVRSSPVFTKASAAWIQAWVQRSSVAMPAVAPGTRVAVFQPAALWA